MIRAIRPNAMAQDDAALVTGWNVAPNLEYVLRLLPSSVSCGVFLYADDETTLIASGAALAGTEQPCILVPQSGQAVEMVDADLGWHLLLTTTGAESQRTIRLGPAVDLPDEIHPVYGEDDLALVRATAAINAAAHYIDDVTVTCPLGLGAVLGDVVSVPVDGVAVVGQVDSITWTATPDGTTEQAVIRRHVAIAPEAFVEPVLPTVVDDTGETDADTVTTGNVLTNDASGLIVTAVNGLAANVGQAVAGSDGGIFTVAANGAWTFDPDGDFAGLTGSDTATTSVTYHASDGAAEAMATLTVTVSSGAAAPWTPAEITTALWLDAADSGSITLTSGKISQWADKSGNNRHATQGASGAQPAVAAAAINGLDALVFDGVDDFLTLGTALGRPSSYTIFSVSKITRALSNAQAIIASVDSSGNSRNSCMTIANDGGATFWQYGYNGSTYRWGYAASGFTVNTVGLHCLVHTSGTQDELVYLNGTLLTNSGLTGTATSNAGTAFATSIGRFGAFSGWYFGGNVAEIVVVLSAISSGDRQKLEGYLAHKWGLAANLPSDHPYKSTPPVV